jgi:hypothetical protein
MGEDVCNLQQDEAEPKTPPLLMLERGLITRSFSKGKKRDKKEIGN